MTDPTIVTLPFDEADVYETEWRRDVLRSHQKQLDERLPRHYRDAVCNHDGVKDWVSALVKGAAKNRGGQIEAGPSLLIVGATGTGKTHQAAGALRALCVSGARFGWRLTTAADLYAAVRPHSGVDSEREFVKYLLTKLLVLDDLGAAKSTEWVEEVNYRLINHRYEHELPTLITSNVPPKELSNAIGERVASRLSEMATRVVLKGADRRLNRGAA